MKLFSGDISMTGSGIVKVEVDDDFNIIKEDYLCFTKDKYQADRSNGKILLYPKEFMNYFEKYKWFYNYILAFIDGCEYASMENYSFASQGLVFNIAEFTGILKYLIYEMFIKIRLYEPTVIKKYAALYGGGEKELVIDAYDSSTESKFDLDYLIPPFNPKLNSKDNRYESPRADIIDAYWGSRLLITELKLRFNKINISDLDKKRAEIFTKVPKKTSRNKNSILNTDFLWKGY